MPEGIEVELYRRAAATLAGRTIASVELGHPAYARDGVTEEGYVERFVGSEIRDARRVGKLLVLETTAGRLGFRFGMTGRLLVDGQAVIDKLEYASDRDDPGWDRFELSCAEGGSLVVRDQRRLGSVEIDPDEGALGVDLFDIDGRALGRVLAGSARPLKARLMDQAQIAGLGNLLTDEVLWRAGLDPRRPADSLDARERRRLLFELRRVPAQLLARGGSHTGDLHEQRRADGICPRDGAALRRHAVGGRTTYACPEHQRPAP